MKLLYCMLCCLATVCLQAQAQETIPFQRFGFQAGASFSNMNWNQGYPTPAVKIDPSWKAGFTVGLILRVPLGDKFLLQPEYNFVQRNSADKSIKTSYELDYISLPLLLHYKLIDQVSIYAGPQGELLVHGSSSTSGTKTDITKGTEERSLGIIGGVEWRIIQSLFLTARYMQGFNHVGVNQRTGAIKEFKYEAVSVAVGVHF